MESVANNRKQWSKDGQIWPDENTVQQEVEEVASGMREVTNESALSEKVETLRRSLNDLSQEVYSWRGQDYYLEAIEGIQQQVDGIQQEWNTVSEAMRIQRERLESLLQAFPGVIEISTLRALSMRLEHLEEVVSDIIDERQNKTTSERARKQLVISIAALAVTIFFWGVFILMRFLP
jgi:hypothetical protein